MGDQAPLKYLTLLDSIEAHNGIPHRPNYLIVEGEELSKI